MSSTPAWATWWVPGQFGIHSKTLSQNAKTKTITKDPTIWFVLQHVILLLIFPCNKHVYTSRVLVWGGVVPLCIDTHLWLIQSSACGHLYCGQSFTTTSFSAHPCKTVFLWVKGFLEDGNAVRSPECADGKVWEAVAVYVPSVQPGCLLFHPSLRLLCCVCALPI